jgi:excisionase family DNA binding protein
VLKVHPKHVYRLLKRGLPAHRVGDEWRFDEAEVRRYCRTRGEEATSLSSLAPPSLSPRSLGPSASGSPAATLPLGAASSAMPPLCAANGDVALEVLLDTARDRGALVGHVQADHTTGLALLRRGAVLLAGCHGDVPPEGALPDGVSLARIHLAERELGLAFRRGLRLRRVSGLVGRRLATRAPTAGIRAHLDAALLAAGIELSRAYDGADVYRSHRDVVMAVLRDAAEVGLASRAWATTAGLGFLPLTSEAYGLVLRADDLGDPRVVALCEIAQSAAYRKTLRGDLGYEPRRTGEIRITAAAK